MKEQRRSSCVEDVLFIPKDSEARRITSGEMSDVYMLDAAGLVVKFPKEVYVAGPVMKFPVDPQAAVHANLREALVVGELRNREKAPLALPRLIECSIDSPVYSIFEKVDGVTLNRQDVDRFSEEERELLGRKIGAFVAWMSTAFTFDDYREILEETKEFIVPNRSRILQKRWREVAYNPHVNDVLGHVMHELKHAHRSLADQGLLTPTVIGHTDLHLGNITFTEHDGVRVPHGIIDFGSTQPTTPESDLRHAAILGLDIGEAATKEYEALTGQELQSRLIGFWAITQVASACAHVAINGNLVQRVGMYKQLEEVLVLYGETVGLDPDSYGHERDLVAMRAYPEW